MNIKDLSHCAVFIDEIEKKESLRIFLSQYENYDFEKLKIALNLDSGTLKIWIKELSVKKRKPIQNEVIKFKLENENYSQRQIAKLFKISVASVNNYLNLQK